VRVRRRRRGLRREGEGRRRVMIERWERLLGIWEGG
jgi:uncharacterized protein YmfQ (DUF2313 family)